MNDLIKILDPQELNDYIMNLGTEIYELDDDVFELRRVASLKKESLRDECKTATDAKIKWENSEEYINWQKKEKEWRQKKSLRTDLRERLRIITNTKYR